MNSTTTVHGPIEAALWLVALVPGTLGGCIACRRSTLWWYPPVGPVHPECVPSAMVLFEAAAQGGQEATAPMRPRAGGRRGAYSRRGLG